MAERVPPANPEIFTTVAEKMERGSAARAVGEVAVSAAWFLYPQKGRLYRRTRRMFDDAPSIDLQPPVEAVAEEVEGVIADATDFETPKLSNLQLTRFVSAFMQFSDVSPVAHAMVTPAENVLELHDETVRRAKQEGPLDYATQLSIALAQTPHVPSALWNLFLTHRQYARWRDEAVIDGFPALHPDEKIHDMLEWESSLAAVKKQDDNGFQDSAGDAYYVWTHALGRMIYKSLPARETTLSRSYAKALEYGSHGMSISGLVGKVSVWGTMSNHIPAAKYGNAIGDAVAHRMDTLRLDATTSEEK